MISNVHVWTRVRCVRFEISSVAFQMFQMLFGRGGFLVTLTNRNASHLWITSGRKYVTTIKTSHTQIRLHVPVFNWRSKPCISAYCMISNVAYYNDVILRSFSATQIKQWSQTHVGFICTLFCLFVCSCSLCILAMLQLTQTTHPLCVLLSNQWTDKKKSNSQSRPDFFGSGI